MKGRLWKKLVAYILENVWKGQKRLDHLRSQLIHRRDFKVESIFAELDVESRGILTVNEFSAFLRQKSVSVSDCDVIRLFAHFDSARRGSIDCRQLLAALTPLCKRYITSTPRVKQRSSRLALAATLHSDDANAASVKSIGNESRVSLMQAVLCILLQQMALDSRICYLCQMLERLDHYSHSKAFNAIDCDSRGQLTHRALTGFLQSHRHAKSGSSRRSRARQRHAHDEHDYDYDHDESSGRRHRKEDAVSDRLKEKDKLRTKKMSSEKSSAVSRLAPSSSRTPILSRRQFEWICAYFTQSAIDWGKIDAMSDGLAAIGIHDTEHSDDSYSLTISFWQWTNTVTPFKRLSIDKEEVADSSHRREEDNGSSSVLAMERVVSPVCAASELLTDAKELDSRECSELVIAQRTHKDAGISPSIAHTSASASESTSGYQSSQQSSQSCSATSTPGSSGSSSNSHNSDGSSKKAAAISHLHSQSSSVSELDLKQLTLKQLESMPALAPLTPYTAKWSALSTTAAMVLLPSVSVEDVVSRELDARLSGGKTMDSIFGKQQIVGGSESLEESGPPSDDLHNVSHWTLDSSPDKSVAVLDPIIEAHAMDDCTFALPPDVCNQQLAIANTAEESQQHAYHFGKHKTDGDGHSSGRMRQQQEEEEQQCHQSTQTTPHLKKMGAAVVQRQYYSEEHVRDDYLFDTHVFTPDSIAKSDSLLFASGLQPVANGRHMQAPRSEERLRRFADTTMTTPMSASAPLTSLHLNLMEAEEMESEHDLDASGSGVHFDDDTLSETCEKSEESEMLSSSELFASSVTHTTAVGHKWQKPLTVEDLMAETPKRQNGGFHAGGDQLATALDASLVRPLFAASAHSPSAVSDHSQHTTVFAASSSLLQSPTDETPLRWLRKDGSKLMPASTAASSTKATAAHFSEKASSSNMKAVAKALFAQISLEKHHEKSIRKMVSNRLWNLRAAFDAISDHSDNGCLTLEKAYHFLCEKHAVTGDLRDVKLLFRRLSASNDANDSVVHFRSFRGSLLPVSETFAKRLLDEDCDESDANWNEAAFVRVLSDMIAVEKTANSLRANLCSRGLDIVGAFGWIDTAVEGRVQTPQIMAFAKAHGYELTAKHCLYLFRRYNNVGFADFVSARYMNKVLYESPEAAKKQQQPFLKISYSQFANEFLHFK